MKKPILLFVSFALISLYQSAYGLDRFDIITTDELYQLLYDQEQQPDFLLINTLDTLIAEHHSIPGSINVPWSKVDTLPSFLGTDTEKLVITYCMGYR